MRGGRRSSLLPAPYRQPEPDDLKALQPGLNPNTYSVLQSEELFQPSVLGFLREGDVCSLDVSVAQHCLLRNLVCTVRDHPERLTDSETAKAQPTLSLPSAVANPEEVCVNYLHEKTPAM